VLLALLKAYRKKGAMYFAIAQLPIAKQKGLVWLVLSALAQPSGQPLAAAGLAFHKRPPAIVES
jgi:hypothetical protein